jgi:hypothetical protein
MSFWIVNSNDRVFRVKGLLSRGKEHELVHLTKYSEQLLNQYITNTYVEFVIACLNRERKRERDCQTDVQEDRLCMYILRWWMVA